MLAELEGLADELGIAVNVRFLGGRPDAAHLWRGVDIGLLVSFHVGIAASAAITLSLGSLYALSLSVGPLGSVLAHRRQAAEHIVRLKTGVSP